MLSPRLITFFALIAAGVAYPPMWKPPIKRPVTSLNRAELEDSSPWIKFPFFGNLLESFPNFLPTIPEAGPKIESNSHKFQVILNVKEYKKQFLKVMVKDGFINIQGAHEDIQDKNSIDSQFIHTYTLPPKASASSVSATLTSDGYLVVTAPIGSVISKPSYNQKEIPILEIGEPLQEAEPENKVSSTSTTAPIIQAPSTELLPPNPILNYETLSTESLIPAIPSVSLLPPEPINDFINVEPSISITPSIELLPPKPTNDDAINQPIVNQPSLSQVNNNPEEVSTEDQILLLSSIITEKPSNEISVVPNIISIPLQQQNEAHQIIVAPTYAYEIVTESQNNLNVVAEEKISTPSSDISENSSNASGDQSEDDNKTAIPIFLFQEPIQGIVTVNQNTQESAPTDNTLVNTNDIYSTTLPLEEPVLIIDYNEETKTLNIFKETTTTNQPEQYNMPYSTTEESLLLEQANTDGIDEIPNVLRSEFLQEQDGFTGEPETLAAEEHFNEEGSGHVPSPPHISLETTTSIENIVDTTTISQTLLQKDDVNELIIEYSLRSFGEDIKNDDINLYITTESATLEDKNIDIGSDSTIEDSTLSDNIHIIDQPEKANSFESLSNIAVLSYNEDLVPSAPRIEESTEQIILSSSETNKTSEVNAF